MSAKAQLTEVIGLKKNTIKSDFFKEVRPNLNSIMENIRNQRQFDTNLKVSIRCNTFIHEIISNKTF